MKKCITFAIAIAIVIAAVLAVNTASFDVAEASGQLTTPQNVGLEKQGGSYFITWTAILDNNGYTIEIDGVEYTVPKDVNKYSADSLSVGVSYEVRVKAIGADGNTDSEYSVLTEIVKSAKLSAPVNVDVSEGELSFDAVANATGYKITVNGVVLAQNQTEVTLDLSDKLFSTGDYSIKIKALGDNNLFLDSDYSAEFIYTHTKTLSTPRNLAVTLTEGRVMASWEGVTYADGYEVCIDGGAPLTATTASLDVTEYVSAVSDHTVKVRARAHGNYLASAYTAEVTYKSESKIDAPILVLTGDVVSWQAPVGANRYTVIIRNGSGNVYTNNEFSGTSVNLADIEGISAVGEYEIKVQALQNGNYKTSDISTVKYIKRDKLATPAVTIEGTTASWTAVPNAVNYTVTVNDRVREANFEGLSYDFSDDLAESGNYIIKVKANESGWYTSSDEGEQTYVHTAKLGKTNVSADGLTISWTEVVGASTYAVTVDGVEVATGVSALTYDVAEYCTQAKTYTIGVYAEAVDNFTAADVATVTVTGVVPAAPATKVYFLGIPANVNYVYFVDGVKVENPVTSTINNNQRIELPSTAEKLIVVIDADALATYEEMPTNSSVFPEIDLSSGVYSEVYSHYTVTADVLSVIEMSVEVQPATAVEGVEYVEYNGKKYYYHVKPNAQIPQTIG